MRQSRAEDQTVSESVVELQQRICKTYCAEFDPPAPKSKVGLAIHTLDRVLIHGVRLPPTETTCGWFIFAGEEWSDAEDFYEPVCVEHMAELCQFALPSLALPTGWRFLTDGKGNFDAWQSLPPHE